MHEPAMRFEIRSTSCHLRTWIRLDAIEMTVLESDRTVPSREPRVDCCARLVVAHTSAISTQARAFASMGGR
jgi:hypothetical protein